MRNSVKIVSMIILLALNVIAVGCTRNDGDIGGWFGMWQVARIDVNSKEQIGYKGNVVLKFQGRVMESCSMQPYHEQISYFANCRIEPEALILSVGSEPVWPAGFAPELMFPASGELRLEIISQSDNKAILRWDDVSDGYVYEYYLKKLYD